MLQMQKENEKLKREVEEEERKARQKVRLLASEHASRDMGLATEIVLPTKDFSPIKSKKTKVNLTF